MPTLKIFLGRPLSQDSQDSGSDEWEYDGSFEEVQESRDDESSDVTKGTRSPRAKSESPSRNRVYYRCDKCSYQTQIQYLLARHVAKHALDQPFQCPCCDYSDDDHLAFVDHWVEEHQKTKFIQCAFCSFRCNRAASLKLHIPKHRPVEMLDCAECEFSSNYVSSMKNHFEAFHSRIYPCEICNERMTKHEMIKHCVDVHGAKSLKGAPKTEDSHESHRSSSPELPERRSSSRELSDGTEATQNIICPFCDFSSTQIRVLDWHIDRLHTIPYSCELCSEVLTKYELVNHSEEVHGATLGASQRFVRKASDSAESAMDQPKVERSVECKKTLKCTICEFTTKNSAERLQSHEESFHKKKYSCRFCDSVMTRYGLIKHSKKKHGVIIGTRGRIPTVKQQPRQPEKLTKAAESTGREAADSEDDNERNPARLGSGEPGPSTAEGTSASMDFSDQNVARNFICGICKYSTDYKKSLKYHMEHIHAIAYKCKYCPVVKTKYGLIKHAKLKHGVVLTARGASFKYFAKRRTGRVVSDTDSSDASGSSPNQTTEVKAEPSVDPKVEPRPSTAAKILPPKAVCEKMLNCQICGFSSRIQMSYIRHMERYHTRRVKCDRCSAVMTKYDLIKHSNQMHNVEMKFTGRAAYLNAQITNLGESPSSSVKIENPQSEQDAPKDLDRVFFCAICSYSANHQSNLQQHVRQLHTVKTSCKLCSATMTTHELVRHSEEDHGIVIKRRGRHHVGDVGAEDSTSITDSPSQSRLTLMQTRANALKNRIAAKTAFLGRIKRDVESMSSTAPDTETANVITSSSSESSVFSGEDSVTGHSSNSTRQDSVPPSAADLHQCPSCDFQTMRDDLFKRHIVKHEPLICTICSSSIAEHKRLPNHMVEHNPPETPFKCPYCDRISRSAWNMFYHLAHHLPALKIFDCPECEFSVVRRDFLQTHVSNVHGTGRSPRKKRPSPEIRDSSEPPIPETNPDSSQGVESHSGPSADSNPAAKRSKTAPGYAESLQSLEPKQDEPITSVVANLLAAPNESTPEAEWAPESPGNFSVSSDTNTGTASSNIRDSSEPPIPVTDPDSNPVPKRPKGTPEDTEPLESLELKQNDPVTSVVADPLAAPDVSTAEAEWTSESQRNSGVALDTNTGTAKIRDSSEPPIPVTDLDSNPVPKRPKGTPEDTEPLESQEQRENDPIMSVVAGPNVSIPEVEWTSELEGVSTVASGTITRAASSKIIDRSEPPIPDADPHSSRRLISHRGESADSNPVAKRSKTAPGYSEIIQTLAPKQKDPLSSLIADLLAAPNESTSEVDWASTSPGNSGMASDANTGTAFCSVAARAEESVEGFGVRRLVYPIAAAGLGIRNKQNEKIETLHKASTYPRVDPVSKIISASTDNSCIPGPGRPRGTWGHMGSVHPGVNPDSRLVSFESRMTPTVGFGTRYTVPEPPSYQQSMLAAGRIRSLSSGSTFNPPWFRRLPPADFTVPFSSFPGGNPTMTHVSLPQNSGLWSHSPSTYPPMNVQTGQHSSSSSRSDFPGPTLIHRPSAVGRSSVVAEDLSVSRDHPELWSRIDQKPGSEGFPYDSDDGEFDESFESVIELSSSEDDDVTIMAEVTATPAPQRDPPAKNTVYYRCDKCSYQTRIQHLLDRHVAKHDLGRPEMLDCSFCEFSSNYVTSMKHHVEVFHKKIHKCDQCDKVTTKRLLVKHRERVHGGESRGQGGINASSDAYSGDEHGESDEFGSWVLDHKDDVPDTPRMSEPAASPEGEWHCLNAADKTSNPETEDAQGVDDVEPELKCSICAFTALKSLSLKYHLAVFHNKKVACDHCPLVMTKHDLIQHAAKEHPAETGPEALASKGPDISSSSRPQRSETDEQNPSSVQDVSDRLSTAKEFKCSYCEYSAATVYQLNDHVFRLHSKQYHCNHCSVVMTKFQLIDHSKKVHGVQLRTIGRGSHLKEARIRKHKASESYRAEEPGSTSSHSMPDAAGTAVSFKCSFCDYSNPRKGGLNDHEFRLHTKKYHCNQCPVIMTKFELIEHCQVDHGKTIRAAGRCGFKAARRVPKSRCSEDKSLSAGQDQESSAQGKATKCPFCDYASPMLAHLELHILRLHTRKYLCTFCSKIMTKYDIIEHSKAVHGVILNAKQSFGKVRSGSGDSPGELCASESNRRSAKIHPVTKHSTASSGKFPCSLCKFSSKSAMGLYRHIERLHKKTSRLRRRGAAIMNGGRVPKNNPVRLPTKKFRKSFNHSNSDANGFQSELELPVRDGPGPSSAGKDVLLPTVVPEGELTKFECKTCDFSSRSKFSLEGHTKRIHTVKYTCRYCPVVKTKFGLLKHYNLKHGVVMKVNGRKSEFSKLVSRSVGEGISTHPSCISKPASEQVRKLFSGEGRAPSSEEMTKESGSRVAAVENMEQVRLKCKKCDWQTAREDLLTRHEAKHAPLKCPVCRSEFSKGYSFAAHLSTHNHPESLCRCLYCGYVAKRKGNLYSHLSKHVEALKKHDCPECAFSCLRPDVFRAHFATHTKIGEGCLNDASTGGPSKSFSVPPKDPSKIADVSQAGVPDTSKPSTVEPKVLVSPLKIGILESRTAVVNAHSSPAIEVVGRELSETSKDLSEPSKVEVAKVIPEETFSLSGLAGTSYGRKSHSDLLRCHNCSYATKLKSLLRRHVKLHLPEAQFVCPKCDFRGSKSRSFARHLTSHSLPGAAMQCCFCSFSTTHINIIQQHLSIHRPVASYYCTNCEYSCSQISALSIHYKRLHLWKYLCPKCPKLATKSVLLHHFKKCHPQFKLKCITLSRGLKQKPIRKNNSSKSVRGRSASQPFNDRISAQQLQCNSENLLQRHDIPLECPVCDIQFTKWHSFTVHLSQHNPQEEPFKCFYCEDVLKDLGELHRHHSFHLDALKTQNC